MEAWIVVLLVIVAIPAVARLFQVCVLRPWLKRRYPGISPLFVYQPLPLLRKEKLTETEEPIYRLVFGLPKDTCLQADLSVGEFVRVKAPGCSGKPRSYSPMRVATPGELELCVKRYQQGRMSTYLCDTAVGDSVLMSGPFPPFWVPLVRAGPADRIGLIAFGVGITEAWPLAELEVAKKTGASVRLLWANRTPQDTFDVAKMREAAEDSDGRLKVTLIYSRLGGEEGDLRGRVCAQVLQDVFGDWLKQGNADHTRFLVVGTKQMKRDCYAMLQDVGFSHKLLRRRFRPFGCLR
eukprot:TRINITY_DN25046_c0_g1_i2.p1 TRINITY_DN25046_c0_g1~~TRINITY_DN25046_c0_g1_i2.p1  ORF type:complete len:294 (-),score=42.12 TRINITY_DN25046_c0_g1_i2:494-1375(-)